jgi:hypothetical protein
MTALIHNRNWRPRPALVAIAGLVILAGCSRPRSQDVGHAAVAAAARTAGLPPEEMRVLDLQVDDRSQDDMSYSVVVRTLCPGGAADCPGKQVFLVRLTYAKEQMGWARREGQESVCEPFLEAKTWRCREPGDS